MTNLRANTTKNAQLHAALHCTAIDSDIQSYETLRTAHATLQILKGVQLSIT